MVLSRRSETTRFELQAASRAARMGSPATRLFSNLANYLLAVGYSVPIQRPGQVESRKNALNFYRRNRVATSASGIMTSPSPPVLAENDNPLFPRFS